MEFPLDIKLCMKDCLLSIFWAKKDIYNFLVANGCTTSDVKNIRNYQTEELNRAQIIEIVFRDLHTRPDRGLAQFRAMLQSLIKWNHFDSYYFEKIKKLDHQTAERNLRHLSELVEIRDARMREEREKRLRAEAEKQKPQNTLIELRQRFLQLMTENSTRAEKQNRGYELEAILLELARLSNLTVTEPFRTRAEQIDGSFKFEGENYLLEAKWQNKEMSNEPLYQFAMKVGGRMYGRGIFVSVNGFGEHAVKALLMGKAINTILVDGEDLIFVLEGNLTFAEMIDKKVAEAQKSGNIYIQPLTGKPKIYVN